MRVRAAVAAAAGVGLAGVFYWFFLAGDTREARAPATAASVATASAPAPVPVRLPETETAAPAPEPVRDVWPAEETGAYDPKAFDAMAWAARATAGARRRWKNVELVVLAAPHVGADGLSDLTVDDRPASYGFRPEGAEAGMAEGCAFWVVVEAARVYGMAEPLASVCGLPSFAAAAPRCTPAAVFAKLAETNRPRPGARAGALTFGHEVRTEPGRAWIGHVAARWSVSSFPTYADDGHATDLVTEVADDCGAPAKKR